MDWDDLLQALVSSDQEPPPPSLQPYERQRCRDTWGDTLAMEQTWWNLPEGLSNRANNAIYLKNQWKRYLLYSSSLHWMSINKSSRWKRRERLLTCTPKKSAWRRLLPAVSAIMEEGPWRCTLSKWRRIKTIRASSRRVDSYNSQARRQSEAGDWRCLPLWKAARSLEGRAARKKIWPEVRLNISFHSCVFNNHLLRSPGQI